MLNIISIVFGVVGIPLAILGFLPFLGWTNWFWLIVPVIGVILGAMSRKKAGFKLNLVVGGIMIVRLLLGGGLF